MQERSALIPSSISRLALPSARDLVQRKDVPYTYQIIHIAHDGHSVTLCLMHGGSATNFEL